MEAVRVFALIVIEGRIFDEYFTTFTFSIEMEGRRLSGYLVIGGALGTYLIKFSYKASFLLKFVILRITPYINLIINPYASNLFGSERLISSLYKLNNNNNFPEEITIVSISVRY